MSTKNQKLMDEVHAVMRLGHYSIHTERSYCIWIKRQAMEDDVSLTAARSRHRL